MPEAKNTGGALARALAAKNKASSVKSTGALGKNLKVPQAADPWAPALSVGQTLLNVISTPLYFVEGAMKKNIELAKKGDFSGAASAASPITFLGSVFTGGVGASGVENVANAFQGKKVATGHELLTDIGMDKNFGNVPFLGGELNLPGLAADILLDPLTYTPGVVVSAPLKMLAKGTTATARAAYDAARALPSIKYVAKNLDSVNPNAIKDIKYAKQTPAVPRPVKNESTSLLREESALGSYARQNVAKRANSIYAAAPVKGGRSLFETIQQIAGSGLEAGLKASKTSLAESLLKHEIHRVDMANAKIVRRAKRKGEDIPVLPNTGTAAIVNMTEDGKTLLDDGTAVDYPIATPVKQGKNYYVDLDGSGQLHRFSDEATAKKFISDKTSTPVESVADVVEFKAKPVFDTNPAALSVAERAATTEAAPKMVQELVKRIKSADKVAQETKGVLSNGDGVTTLIRNVIRDASVKANSDAAKLVNASAFAKRYRGYLASKELDAASVWGALSRSEADRTLFRYLNEYPVTLTGEEGKRTALGNIMKVVEQKGWDNISPADKQAITNTLLRALSGGDTGSIAKELRTSITRIVGDEKLASDVIANISKPQVLDEILANIANRAGEVSFKNAEHLITSIASGQATVAPDVLIKLAKLLSPDAADYGQIVKDLKNDPAGMTLAMRSILVKGGMQTLKTVETRLALLDAETFALASGISHSDVLAASIDNAITGVRSTNELADSVTRQAAGERLAAASAESISKIDTMAESVAQGLVGRFKDLVKTDKNIGTFISRFGQGTTKDGDKYLLVQELPANFEVNILGRFFQLTGQRLGRRVKKATFQGDAYIPDDKLIDEFITNYGLLRDYLLAGFGSRISHAKSVERVKAGEEYFWAYVDMGDFAAVMKETGNVDLFNKAFYPYGIVENTLRKGDWLSPIGIGKAITAAMESVEKGVAIDQKALIAHIKSMAESQTKRTDGYIKVVDEIAPKIAEVISKNVEYFQKQHVARMTAEVNDGIVPAQNFMYETLDTVLRTVKLRADRGTLTAAEYQRQAETLFNRFIVAGDIYNQKNARVTEALMRSVAKMFMSMTDMKKLIDEFKASGELTQSGIALAAMAKAIPNDEYLAHYQRILQEINTYHEWRNPGSELAGLTTVRKEGSLQSKLGKAEEAYRDVMNEFKDVVDAATEKAWRKKYDKAQKALDALRVSAKSVAMRVKYWDNELGDFVPEEHFNYEEVVKRAEASPIGQETIKRNKGNKKAVPADKKIVYKDMKQLSPAQSKQIKDAYRKRAEKLAKDKAESHYEQASINANNYEAEIEAMFPDDPIEQLLRQLEQHFSETAQLPALKAINDKLVSMKSDTLTFGGTEYRAGKMAGGNAPGLEQRGFIDRVAEKASATARRGATAPIFNINETRALNTVGGFAGLVQRLIKQHTKQMPENGFAMAVRAAVSGPAAIDAVADASVKAVATGLYSVLDETIQMARSLPLTKPDVLRNALVSRLGGMIDAADLKSYESVNDILDHMFEVLPIGPKPTNKAQSEWDDMMAAFNKQKESGKGVDELQILTRTVDALFFVATQHNLAFDLVKRFGWENYGFNTLEEAKRAGFVKLNQIDGKSFNIGDYLPQDGSAYFHPEIAKQIAASIRAWDKTYGDPTKAWLKSMMGIMSALKATQTVLRPGHWVANFFGDSSVAFMDGMKPTDLAKGYDLSVTFAKEQIGADWAAGQNGIDAAIRRSLGNIKSLSDKGSYQFAAEGYPIMIAGKKRFLPKEELVRLFADTNVFVKDFAANDSDGARWLIESMLGGNETEQLKNAMLQKLQKATDASRIARGWQQIVKPAGDFTAYLGNGIRGGHALSHIQSRVWANMEELTASLNEMVNLYHPTIQSLSAAERKAPRMLFTYYTWLRGAHATFLELMLNHTAAMMVPSKAFYNQAIVGGQEPQSIGNMWGDKSKTPSYLNYSVYGPTGEGPRGGTLYKPSILPLDVLDTWNIQFDSTLPADQNLFNALKSVGRTLGASSNILMQPGIEFLTGTDVKTGKPSQVKDLATAADKMLSNVGFMQLLKGMGVYTPQNKIDNKTNPLTDRDRELAGLNWWTGLKFGDVNTTSNVKNARTEEAARKKRIAEILAQQINQGK